MMTTEQIQAARAQLGIPSEGYGNNTSYTGGSTGNTPASGGLAAKLQGAWGTAPEPVAKPGFFQNLKNDFKSRVNNASDSQLSNQNPLSKVLQTLGQGAGFIGDIGMDAAKAVGDHITATDNDGEEHNLTDSVGDLVHKGLESAPVQAASQSAPIQAIADLAARHPEATKNLEAVGNIASIIPEGKIASIGADAAADTTKSAVSKVADAAETLTPSREKAIDSLEGTYRDLAGTTMKTRKVLNKAQAKTEAMNKSGTVGDSPERLLAEQGIVPKQSGTKLETIDQAEEFRKSTEPLREANRDAIREVEHSVPKTSIDDLEKRALAIARDEKNVDSGKSVDMVRDIQNAYAEYRNAYGESIPLSKVDDIKSARWADTKFDATRPLKSDVNYAIAKSAQKTIEDTARGAGFEDVAQLNRHIGDRLEAAKFLESLHGKTLAKGHIGKYVLMGIGSTLGSTIPGKILGALGGDAVANLLISNSVAGPVKRLILRSVKAKDPKAYEDAIKWLEEQNALRETRPRLPEGKPGTNPIPLGGRNSQLQDIDAGGNLIQKDSQILNAGAPEPLPIELPSRLLQQGKPGLISGQTRYHSGDKDYLLP